MTRSWKIGFNPLQGGVSLAWEGGFDGRKCDRCGGQGAGYVCPTGGLPDLDGGAHKHVELCTQCIDNDAILNDIVVLMILTR